MQQSLWFNQGKATRVLQQFEERIVFANELARECKELNITTSWYAPDKRVSNVNLYMHVTLAVVAICRAAH